MCAKLWSPLHHICCVCKKHLVYIVCVCVYLGMCVYVPLCASLIFYIPRAPCPHLVIPWYRYLAYDGCFRKAKQELRSRDEAVKCHPKASWGLLKISMSYFAFCICSKKCSLTEHLGTRPRENIAILFLPAVSRKPQLSDFPGRERCWLGKRAGLEAGTCHCLKMGTLSACWSS